MRVRISKGYSIVQKIGNFNFKCGDLIVYPYAGKYAVTQRQCRGVYDRALVATSGVILSISTQLSSVQHYIQQ